MDGTEVVYCETCEFLDDHSIASKRSWGAMCMKFPNIDMGYVTKNGWDLDPPYRRCATINTNGHCPLYEPRRTNEEVK